MSCMRLLRDKYCMGGGGRGREKLVFFNGFFRCKYSSMVLGKVARLPFFRCKSGYIERKIARFFPSSLSSPSSSHSSFPSSSYFCFWTDTYEHS